MSEININAETLNSLRSKSRVTVSDVSGNNELKKIFKICDIDKPVDVLETNKELSAWKNQIDNLQDISEKTPDYKVKEGDYLAKIVKNLGYTGIDAKKYEQALTAQLKQNGSFMNDKNWLIAGSTIKLLSDAKIKELGIKKFVSNSNNNSNDNQNNDAVEFTYLVQRGDTLPKIIKALGYSGEEAKKYEQALDEQLSTNGSYMNDKKWLMAGSKIKLLSNSKLNELGLGRHSANNSPNPTSTLTTTQTPVPTQTQTPVPTQTQTPVQTQTQTPVQTQTSVPSNRPVSANRTDVSVEDDSALDKSITTPKKESSASIPKNSVDLIQKTIKANGHNSEIADVNSLSADQKKMYNKYKSVYPIEPTVIKNTSTGETHLFFDVSNTKNGKGLGQQSVEIVFQKDGNWKKTDSVITNRYYTNGKIVQDKDWEELDGSSAKVPYTAGLLSIPGYKKKHTAKILNQPVTKPKQKKVIDTPVQISSISINPNVLKGTTPEQKQNIRTFMRSLISNKAKLMRDLHLDNDAYNNFVQLAIGIAIQESGLENGLGAVRSAKNSDAGQAVLDTLRVANIAKNKVLGTKSTTATSKGMTQIKIGDWNDDPKIDKLFKQYGITADGYYNNISPDQSAIATMIVLNELANKVKNNKDIQNGIEAAKDRFYITNSIRDNGVVKNYPNGYVRVNQDVTENDAIMYLYNGRTGALKNGDMTPKDNAYTHNVRRYMSAVTIKEDETQKVAAMKKARTVTEGLPNNRVKMNTDLGWGIGQVAFGTTLYTEGVSKNTAEEINNLKTVLLQRGYNPNNVNALIAKLNNGDISFTNKLSESEINSMTESDVELLLKYSQKLSTQLKNVSQASKKREIASNIDKEFKREYLSSHAQQTYMSEVKGKTVKLTTSNKNIIKGFHNTGAQERCQRYLNQLRGEHKPDAGLWLYDDRVSSGKYTGFCVEKDKGINTTNASDIDILLAKNGADTANTLKTSGACLTGTKQSLIGSGAVKPEEMTTFSNAFELANFFEKHPERFIEITHIQLSDTVAREITAGDLSNLPAGCIVIFGNKNRSDVVGHAAITSGNGQMYADEVDNSNWDNFVAKKANHNGKGEHGYFRVFKLNPTYFGLDDSNKKLVKKQ